MNEELLTFYYYGDGLTDAERAEVEAALAADPQLAKRYAELCHELDGFKPDDTVSAPPHLVHRWHEVIDRAARSETSVAKPPRTFHLGSFFWGTAVAASLAVAIAIGVYTSDDDIAIMEPGNVVAGTDAPAATSAALSRGLLVHFQDSRRQLIGLSPGANGERSELVMNIVQQNRLFARAAAQSESQDLARLLRAFEPVLLKLAAEDISPQDAAALQAQLNFELNVVLTKLSRRLSNETDSIDI